MTDRYKCFDDRLVTVKAEGRERRVVTLVPTGPTTATLDGREVIVACSNDYLGLAWDPDVRAAAEGGGAGSARLISGSRPAHGALEDAIEDWLGKPALCFASGYQANLALFATVCQSGDVVASDASNHASIIDGLRLSRASRVVVPHATPEAIPGDARLMVVEGLFSMDGDVPPFLDYPSAPWLAVDEAHAVGVLGPNGRGAAAASGVDPDFIVGTFGKAFGAQGAFVAGPPSLIAVLVNEARSFIFTTAPSEPMVAMALAGLRQATDERRQRLAHNVARFRGNLRDLGWAPLGEHHIVPLVTGPRTMALDAKLLEAGVFVRGIRWPTVPRGQERLRFTVSAAHTPEALDRICDALGSA